MLATILLLLVLAFAMGCGGRAFEHATAPTPAAPPPTLAQEAEQSGQANRPLTNQEPATAPAEATATPLPGTPAPRPGGTNLPRPDRSVGDVPPTLTPAPAETLGTLQLVPLPANVRFQAPTNLIQAQNGTMLVSEQSGKIWALSEEQPGQLAAGALLDISDRVSRRRSEEGLLGLTLDRRDERYVYVYYSAAGPRRSVVSRFIFSPDQNSVLPDSELVILEVDQPYANHNGGQIAFGPDGYLYIGLGDGGSAGDPAGNGQDTSTVLGSILRIDVSPATPRQPYAIPPDNPFVNGGGRPEIWAYGLRNPWRFSFDRNTGALWAGDVGQNRWEEIDLIQPGGNYGWNVLEGNHCFRPRDGCEREGMAPPIWEYSLDGEPCSVIGGYVYRGSRIPWLRGAYVFGDYCSGEIFVLRHVDTEVIEHRRLLDTELRIMSFAEDNDGEIFLLSQDSGIYRLAD